MESIGGTKLVPRLGQTFHHRCYLGAKLAHPVVIEKRGQHTLDIVRADLELDRIVTTADICLDGFDTGLDRGIARKPRLGFAQRRLRSGFHPSNEQQAQRSRRQCRCLALAC